MPDMVAKPEHVPAELVRDFDFCNVPGADTDPQLALDALHAGPDVFWTPHYGGHWVATRADDIDEIHKNHERFSHREIILPRGWKAFPYLPIEVDPPAHTQYRRLINPPFSPAAVASREQEARQLAIGLIEGIKPRGACEFVHEFAEQMPVTVALGMLELAVDRRETFTKWAETMARSPSKEERVKTLGAVMDYVKEVIRGRAANPGKDVISQIIKATIDGRPITEDEALSMCTLLFLGGLDTVASMLGFIALFLARNPAHRRQLIESPQIIPAAVEELLRRHGLSQTFRYIVNDTTLRGAGLRAREMIMESKALHGLDERRFPEPLKVDFARKPIHATFGNGPHKCPGANLARKEIAIFIQEWLRRIPDFEVTPGKTPKTATGGISSVVYLPLSWKV
jgi:cytochrome P450